ncbi:MAG: general secretion pathway protein GspK [Gammaproteobacteria bacterium]
MKAAIQAPAMEQGLALVIVLWVVALLSIVAASLAFSMRTETTLAHDLVAQAQARALAEAGVYRGILELYNPDRLRRWRGDGSPHRVRLAGVPITVSLQDEAGKIDLNSAQRGLLDALLRTSGIEDERRDALLDAIEDWRDPDTLRRLNGAEDQEYEAAGRTYGAKDATFNTVEELQQVLGVTARLYERLRPALTVHSHSAGIDDRMAPPEVLRALLLSGEDRDLEEVLARRRDAAVAEPGQNPRDALAPVIDARFVVPSNGVIYTVRAEARLPPQTRASIAATIKLAQGSGKPYTVLTWHEGD